MQLRRLLDLELGSRGMRKDALKREHFVVELLASLNDLLKVEVVVPIAQHVERVITIERSRKLRQGHSLTEEMSL